MDLKYGGVFDAPCCVVVKSSLRNDSTLKHASEKSVF